MRKVLRNLTGLSGIVIVTAAAIGVAVATLGAQTPIANKTCMARQWSSPHLLDEGQGAPFEITNPSLLPGPHGEIYIVGRGPWVEGKTGLYLKIPFVSVLIHPDGKMENIGTPRFGGQFAAPRGGVGHDTLHVFWGEPDSTDATPQPQSQYEEYVPIIRGIWTADYVSKTKRWSTPTFLAGRENTNWQLAKGWARSDWSPNVNLAFVGVQMVGRNSAWIVSWLKAGRVSPMKDLEIWPGPMYTALMSPAPSHVILGYVMNDFSVKDDHASVFEVRSTDGGSSWSKPVRIALSGKQPASDFSIVQTPNGQLHAVWARDTVGGGFGGQVIGYSVSADTGRSWSAPEYTDMENMVGDVRVVADLHNGIHVIYEGSLPDGWPGIFYTSRGPGTSWSKPIRIFGDTLSGRMPEVTRTASGDLLLLFAEGLNKTGKLGHFSSAVSYLFDRRSCLSN